jgi:hypothetical protein
MTDKRLGSLEPEAFEELIESFIERSEPDTMSFEAFDQSIQRLAAEAVAETIEVTGMIEEGSIVFDSLDSAPITAQGNEILIGGLRLVVRLRQPEAA